MPGAGASGGGSGGGGGFGTDAVNAIMKHMGDPDGSNPTCIWIFAGYKKGLLPSPLLFSSPSLALLFPSPHPPLSNILDRDGRLPEDERWVAA